MIRPRLLEQKSLPRAWEEIDQINITLEQKINREEVVIVDNHSTPDPTKMLSANQGVVLWNAIQAIAGQGSKFDALALLAEKFGKNVLQGTLPKNSSSISAGQKLYNPTVFLDGARLDQTQFTVDLETGTIAMSVVWSVNYDVTWVVIDELPYHIKFSYPTMAMLQATSESFKNAIQINDVIEILGTNGADDGGHYRVKCQDTQGLNGVEITTGKWLNEIPNTKIKDIVDKTSTLEGSISTANVQINQNKTDITTKLDRGSFVGNASDLKLDIDKKIDNVLDGTAMNNKSNRLTRVAPSIDNPSDTHYALVCFGNQSNVVGQLATDFVTGEGFIRSYNEAHGWVQWRKIFDNVNCPISKQQNGYCKLANGLIIQWGSIILPNDEPTWLVFPVSFNSQTSYSVLSATSKNVGDKYREDLQISVVNVDGAKAEFASAYPFQSVRKWIAIGY